jgi:3-deoxy-D-manno-octulosonic-acid transferase
LGLIIYNIVLLLLKAGIYTGSLFDKKAKLAIKGRKKILQKLRNAIPAGTKLVWIHCASLGEFEQGRPVIEAIKKNYPQYKILLTFFSPSGFEVQKNYSGAEWIFYLPFDSPSNARAFLQITQPSLVIFVKYEYWYYYLKKIKYRNIPLIQISALFRPDMSFFKFYGALQRKILTRFDHVFVQNESSKLLLDSINLGSNVSNAGDTRFDRVAEIAEKFEPDKTIERLLGETKAIVAGSTWPEDEALLANALQHLPDKIKLIIAPHEISPAGLEVISKIFPGSAFYSELKKQNVSSSSRVLVIDNYGMLSRIYKYGFLSYVGGGFRKSGVHNVLEAAVFDKIVLFGPEYYKYYEAIELIKAGGAISIPEQGRGGSIISELVNALLSDNNEFNYRSRAAGDFVRRNKGATRKIMNYIQENRLLTS